MDFIELGVGLGEFLEQGSSVELAATEPDVRSQVGDLAATQTWHG